MILGPFLFLCFLFVCGSNANNLMQRQSEGTSRSQGTDDGWIELCTSCDVGSSPSDKYVGSKTLIDCKQSCREYAGCTAIDYGKGSGSMQCYHNYGGKESHTPSSNYDAYILKDNVYELRENSWCYSERDEIFSTLSEAKHQCSGDPTCTMFFDAKGQGKKFLMCGEDSVIKASSLGALLYIKPTSETCEDGIKNQDEIDIDCGGACSACETCSFQDGTIVGGSDVKLGKLGMLGSLSSNEQECARLVKRMKPDALGATLSGSNCYAEYGRDVYGSSYRHCFFDPLYWVADENANCPANQVIATKSECMVAAVKVGMNFHDRNMENVERPSGCYKMGIDSFYNKITDPESTTPKYDTAGICEQETCMFGYAYHSGKMVNDNAPAKNAAECLQQCNILPDCKFWDFGTFGTVNFGTWGNNCRLRSNNGNGPEKAQSYTYGPKFCYLETCKFGYAYHSGKMVNNNGLAKNAAECLQQCNILPDCKFWDFSGNYCRLRSNNGNGPEKAQPSYTYGPKFCYLDKPTTCITQLPVDYKCDWSCDDWATKGDNCDDNWTIHSHCSTTDGLIRNYCQRSCGACSVNYVSKPVNQVCASSEMIASLDECKLASYQLNLDFTETESEPKYPKGCYKYTRGGTYWNTHSSGSASLYANAICNSDTTS